MTIPKNANPLYIYFKLIPLITTEINSEFLYRICIPDHISADIPVPDLFILEIYYDCPYHVFQWNKGTRQVEAFISELQDSIYHFLIHSAEKNRRNFKSRHESKTTLF